MKKTNSALLYAISALMLIIAGVLVWVILNQQWLEDWWRGKDYQPTGEMLQIRDSLGLTERGEFLFRASTPQLSERDEFNAVCRAVEDEEIAVLGCYTDKEIYVYNIDSEELDGIKELTTAHELLHAVWDRMSEGERGELASALKQVYDTAGEYLKDELTTYEESQRQEELFVRAGTEVMNVPTELEKVYAEVFQDQDAVVAFYNKYIAVFRAMEAEMDALEEEMKAVGEEIENTSSEYEIRMEQLNADITSFNACAETAGCFGTDNEFYARRSELLARQGELNVMYERINQLIDKYNELVAKYNADVTKTNKLNQVMNSNSRPENL